MYYQYHRRNYNRNPIGITYSPEITVEHLEKLGDRVETGRLVHKDVNLFFMFFIRHGIFNSY